MVVDTLELAAVLLACDDVAPDPEPPHPTPSNADPTATTGSAALIPEGILTSPRGAFGVASAPRSTAS